MNRISPHLAPSGAAMDQHVPKRRGKRIALLAGAAVSATAFAAALWAMIPRGLQVAQRDVRIATVEKGVFSKDEISEYTVTTELSNPHRQPIDVRVLDQLPIPGDKNVEIKLLRSEPPATPDRNTGGLTWRLSVPPGGKIETRFVYTLRRPKGARLYQ